MLRQQGRSVGYEQTADYHSKWINVDSFARPDYHITIEVSKTAHVFYETDEDFEY